MIQKAWWKEGVVYQIYPRSFADSNGDGIGDLRGIIGKLDYLKELGVNIVWLSPVYQSPNDDNGYDISDYQAIMAEFGTMADFDELLAQMHRRGIRLLMDLVVNHSSDEHTWFVESRASKESPYRDYYIWRPGEGGREPNNWQSLFGGPAWEYDAAAGEYYLHLFSKKQPDLNWENPQLREAVYAMMRWWLDKGVDGFRMDAINAISKAPGLPDVPLPPDGRYPSPNPHFFNGPRLAEFLLEMRRQTLDHYEAFSVAEAPFVTTADGVALTDEASGPLNMLFQFEHMNLDNDTESIAPRWIHRPLDLPALKQIMTRWQKDLEGRGWNSQYLENHDLPRSVSRFGDDGRYRVESAMMLATFVHLLHGTPYIYQGEEIGMTNVAFESIDDYRDIETINGYRDLVGEHGVGPDRALEMVHARSRDNARTPMQWDDSPNAGFTSGVPWIGVNPNYPQINVAGDRAAPDSIFSYYQRLIRLRKANPVIVYGSYDLLLAEHPQIYAFTRTLGEARLLVALNFSRESPTITLPAELAAAAVELLIANYPIDAAAGVGEFALRPYEARVYRI
jgi:oligo-1,6-glucosidase